MSNFDRLFITAFNKKHGTGRHPAPAATDRSSTPEPSTDDRGTFDAAYNVTPATPDESATARPPMMRSRSRRLREMLANPADAHDDLPPPRAPSPAEAPSIPSLPPAYVPYESPANVDTGPQPLHRKRQRLRSELRSVILPIRRANEPSADTPVEAPQSRSPRYRLDEAHPPAGETEAAAIESPAVIEFEVPERLPPVDEATNASGESTLAEVPVPESSADEVPGRLPPVEETDATTLPLSPAIAEASEASPATVPLSTLSMHRAVAQANDPALNPRLKVHRFTWPPICRELVEAAGPELLALGTAVGVRLAARHLAILVAGANPAVGTTIVVLTLAYYLAKQGRKVAVVDADVNNPQLAKQLRVGIPSGWDGFIRGDKPLEEVLVESIADNIALVGLRSKPREGLSLLESFRFDTALRVLKQRYEVVLVDGASASSSGAATKAVLNSARFESALVVAKPDQLPPANKPPDNNAPTAESHRAALEKLIAKAGIDLLGVVLNRSLGKLAK